jgi:putative endonuclease
VGFTNNLQLRLLQHRQEATKANSKTFAGKYQCVHLVFNETGQNPNEGILREKEIKSWRREKKTALIESFNPEWQFLEDEILE